MPPRPSFPHQAILLAPSDARVEEALRRDGGGRSSPSAKHLVESDQISETSHPEADKSLLTGIE